MVVYKQPPRSCAVQPDYVNGRVVCGSAYEDIHYKDLLG